MLYRYRNGKRTTGDEPIGSAVSGVGVNSRREGRTAHRRGRPERGARLGLRSSGVGGLAGGGSGGAPGSFARMPRSSRMRGDKRLNVVVGLAGGARLGLCSSGAGPLGRIYRGKNSIQPITRPAAAKMTPITPKAAYEHDEGAGIRFSCPGAAR